MTGSDKHVQPFHEEFMWKVLFIVHVVTTGYSSDKKSGLLMCGYCLLMDFKKYIRKARLYPDKETWREEDQESYDIVSEHNVMDRPEMTRHMDPDIRKTVTFDDTVKDVKFYSTHAKWRESSPVIFWAAHEAGWLMHEDVIAFVGIMKVKWTFNMVRKEASLHQRQSVWEMKSPASYKTAKRNMWHVHPSVVGHMDKSGAETPFQALLKGGKILIGPDDIARFPKGCGLIEDLMERAAASGHKDIYRLSDDMFFKPDMITYAPDLIQTYIVEALRREQNWEIYPSCETVAWEMKIPHNPKWRGWFESPDKEAIYDLTQIHGRKKKASHISVRKVGRPRLISPDTDTGKLLRGLTAVPKGRMDRWVKRVLDPLPASTLMEVRAIRHECSAPLKEALKRYLG
jgi:hypothetical protein